MKPTFQELKESVHSKLRPDSSYEEMNPVFPLTDIHYQNEVLKVQFAKSSSYYSECKHCTVFVLGEIQNMPGHVVISIDGFIEFGCHKNHFEFYLW